MRPARLPERVRTEPALRRFLLWTMLGLLMLAAASGVAHLAHAATLPAQLEYATPDQAFEALLAAVRADNRHKLLRILGPGGHQLIHSGDPVADKEGRLRLVTAYDTAHRVQVDGPSATLLVGTEDWPFPVALVRKATRWHFDTDASLQKIIDRRVGRNELNVIEVCRAFVAAEREYASTDRLGDGVHEYALRFQSTAGRHDGLYWDAPAGEQQSPIGPLVVRARAEGYAATSSPDHPEPYHGYYYRILTRQGAHAPGGAKDYIVNGHMTGGFALLAFPARWGDSGIMSFTINQNGIVFQKNLGPDSARLARDIAEYDPDPGWTAP